MKKSKSLLLLLSLAMAPLAAHAQSVAPASAVANPAGTQTAPATASAAPAPIAPIDVAPAPVATVASNPATPAEAKPTTPAAPPLVRPEAGWGMPSADRLGLQPQVTAIGQDAVWMHNIVLMPVITVISLFVLGLLLWVVARYRRAANPVPSRNSHNTTLEVVWTLAPVLILLCIAVPSIKLLARQYSPPKADMTVKVIGNQWYWTYQYPDNGDFEVVSNMLKDTGDPTLGKGERARTDLDGPRLLAVDERMVVPVGKVIKVIVTSADVIHSFAVPAFWTKMDAVPGRLNETWFKIERPGVYFGQCSELCGPRHGFMPIAVEAVSPTVFAQWVASKGGTMPGPGGARNPDATATSPAATPAAGTSPSSNPPQIGTPATTDATVNTATTAAPAIERATANP